MSKVKKYSKAYNKAKQLLEEKLQAGEITPMEYQNRLRLLGNNPLLIRHVVDQQGYISKIDDSDTIKPKI